MIIAPFFIAQVFSTGKIIRVPPAPIAAHTAFPVIGAIA